MLPKLPYIISRDYPHCQHDEASKQTIITAEEEQIATDSPIIVFYFAFFPPFCVFISLEISGGGAHINIEHS